MKLLFLYGPPASGKLTIAEKLSVTTGIPVFHNHLSRDLVKSIYGDNVRQHYGLIDQIRYDILDYCSMHNTDLIFTYVYEGEDEDDADIRKFTGIINSNHGTIHFIELIADREDLIERASNESRKRYKKLVDPVKMADITKNMDKYSIHYIDPLRINTSHLNPSAAVAHIIQTIKL